MEAVKLIEEREGIYYTGDFTAKNPQRYVINRALCEAVQRGEWNVVMLEQLAKWAIQQLGNE